MEFLPQLVSQPSENLDPHWTDKEEIRRADVAAKQTSIPLQRQEQGEKSIIAEPGDTVLMKLDKDFIWWTQLKGDSLKMNRKIRVNVMRVCISGPGNPEISFVVWYCLNLFVSASVGVTKMLHSYMCS